MNVLKNKNLVVVHFLMKSAFFLFLIYLCKNNNFKYYRNKKVIFNNYESVQTFDFISKKKMIVTHKFLNTTE